MKQVSLSAIPWDELIKHPVCAIFPEMDQGAYNELKTSLRENGQLEPVMMSEDLKRIDDGWNRLKALRENGAATVKVVTFEEIRSQMADDGQLLKLHQYIMDKNLARRQLTKEQRTKINTDYMAWFKQEAAGNKAAGQTKGGKTGGRGRAKTNNSLTNDRASSYRRDRHKSNVSSTVGMVARAEGISRRQAARKFLIANYGTLLNEINDGGLKLITAEAIIRAREKGYPELEAGIRAGEKKLNEIMKLPKKEAGYTTYAPVMTRQEANHEFVERVEKAWNEFVQRWDLVELPEVIKLIQQKLAKKVKT